jgi:hypothetical protein
MGGYMHAVCYGNSDRWARSWTCRFRKRLAVRGLKSHSQVFKKNNYKMAHFIVKVWRWKFFRPHAFMSEHDKFGATFHIHRSGISFIPSGRAGSSFPDSSSAVTRSFQLILASTLRTRCSSSWRAMPSLSAVAIDLGSFKLALLSILNSLKMHSLASRGIRISSLIV